METIPLAFAVCTLLAGGAAAGVPAAPAPAAAPAGSTAAPQPPPAASPPPAAPATGDDGWDDTGGFGGLLAQATSVKGALGLAMGGAGAALFGHRLLFGGAGLGLVSPVSAGLDQIDFDFGGLLFGYVLTRTARVHAAIEAIVGAGEIGNHAGRNEVAVADIEAVLLVPVIRSVELQFGAGYRFVAGLRLEGLSARDVGGPTGSIAILFGSF